MKLQSIAKTFWDKNKSHLIFGRTFSRNEQRYVRFEGIPEDVEGIYFIFRSGADPLKDTPYYIGQTGRCIKWRIKRHKTSLRNPEWLGENTGQFFTDAGIDLDQDFDVYYIDSKRLGLTCRNDRITAEELLIKHLKPQYRFYEDN